MKWLLIEKVSGVDVIDCVVDLTLGKKPKLETRQPAKKYVVNDFIYCKAGRFERLEGFEEQVAAGNASEYHCLRSKGIEFDGNIRSSSDRIAGVTFMADDLEELNNKRHEFLKSVKVIDDSGNDLMRRDLLPDVEKR